VTGWLQAQGIAATHVWHERLHVEPGWETAVETVLGSHLQAVCVDGVRRWLLRWRVSAPVRWGCSARAAARFRLRRACWRHACARTSTSGACSTACTPAIRWREALALQPRLAHGESVVTRDGIWLGRDWLRLARDSDAHAGVIQRNREIAALEESHEIARTREAELLAVLDEAHDELRRLEAELLRLAAGTARCNRALHRGAGRAERLQRASRAVAVARRAQPLQSSSSTASVTKRSVPSCNRRVCCSRQRSTQCTATDSSAIRCSCVATWHARGSIPHGRQARSVRDEAHRLAMRRESLETQLGSLRAALARIETQFEQFESRVDALETQIEATTEPITTGRERLEEQLQQRLGVEGELTAARARVQGIEHELRELERSRHAIEQETEAVRGELERERIAAQTVQVRLAAIVEQLNKGHADLAAVLDGLAPEAGEEAWQAQIERLGNQIARLGPINLAAIEEHRAQSERKTYLDAQNADLVEALETLENAIRKIDRETRTRFKDTFDRVNSGLQELFPRVFGGGHAYLEMTGEDLLDTGVAIMARPPGKRNATIHLLSGGEKALTAISLVFSIFRLNPSPFCMLDEVDAPLDDANVGRFARLVREMSDTVQFIVITHNKITMEMAHQLMGVTMQEPGVSRLVSVDVDEAVAMANTG
jgi:chromosome segregation protein